MSWRKYKVVNHNKTAMSHYFFVGLLGCCIIHRSMNIIIICIKYNGCYNLTNYWRQFLTFKLFIFWCMCPFCATEVSNLIFLSLQNTFIPRFEKSLCSSSLLISPTWILNTLIASILFSCDFFYRIYETLSYWKASSNNNVRVHVFECFNKKYQFEKTRGYNFTCIHFKSLSIHIKWGVQFISFWWTICIYSLFS